MATYAVSFTALGAGSEVSVASGNSISYAISGTFVATWQLQRSTGKGWATILTDTVAATGTIVAERNYRYRFYCSAFTSGTMVSSIVENVGASTLRLILPAAAGKVGTTAGWVSAAANNLSLATVAASQTSSTLVVPVTGLLVGDRITGFFATGQIESGGNAVTLDIALRRMTAAAADVTDAAVASITQVSVTADTILSSSNTRSSDLIEVVGADESFYFLLTATTLASTDIALQSLTVEIVR